jgi:hypothetical protein
MLRIVEGCVRPFAPAASSLAGGLPLRCELIGRSSQGLFDLHISSELRHACSPRLSKQGVDCAAALRVL